MIRKERKLNLFIAAAILIIPIALVIFLWAESPECPESCDDSNNCTKDYCGEHTEYECVHDPMPCVNDSISSGSRT